MFFPAIFQALFFLYLNNLPYIPAFQKKVYKNCMQYLLHHNNFLFSSSFLCCYLMNYKTVQLVFLPL